MQFLSNFGINMVHTSHTKKLQFILCSFDALEQLLKGLYIYYNSSQSHLDMLLVLLGRVRLFSFSSFDIGLF